MNTFKSISFIIPTYKQEKIILEDIKNLQESLNKLSTNYEIIVVADGFFNSVSKIVKNIKDKRVKVVGYEKNQGKGFAVKFGMLLASGDIVGFIDAGLDIDPDEILSMIEIMQKENADIVIGSKLHPNSKVNYPIFRKILSGGYRFVTHSLFGFSVKDTQVGLKIFRKKVANDIFSRLTIKRFAFDVEVLAIANSLGYSKIYDAPIKVNFKHNTINYLNSLKIVFWMLIDTMKIFYRFRISNAYGRLK